MALYHCLAAYAAGILLASRCDPTLPWLTSPFLVAAFCLLLRRCRATAFLLPLFFCSLGIALYLLQMQPPAEGRALIRQIGPEQVIVEGKVLQINRRSSDGATVDLAVTRIEKHGKAAAVEGTLRLTVHAGVPNCLPGDIVRCGTVLREPRRFGTPGEFDLPRHLAAHSIWVNAGVAQADQLLVMREGHGLDGWLERQRMQIGAVIDVLVPPSEAPLVRALATGDGSTMPQEMRDRLARAGTAHLFAISGQQLSLCAAFLLLPALALWRRSEWLLLELPPRRFLPLLLLPALLAFTLWSGGALSTWRALLVCCAATALLVSARRTAPLQVLAAAALAMLLASPAILYEPAAQLSFAAVAGILLWVPSAYRCAANWPRPLRWGFLLLLTTAAACTATLPLVVLHFHLLAPAGLLLNPVAVPLVSLAGVPASLAGVALHPVWPDAAALLFQWCGWIMSLFSTLTDQVLHLPGLGGIPLYASPPLLLALALACLALLLPLQGSMLRPRLALAGGALLLALPRPSLSPPAVTIFSVGQGESILLTRAEGRHYLIDGGGTHYGSFDPGARLVAPALGRLGVRRLEAVIMSHPHPDHSQGLAHICQNFPVDAFWLADGLEPTPELHAVLQSRAIPIRRFPPGWSVLDDDPNHALSLFSSAAGDANDRSLVVYASLAGQGLLLTGDIERTGMARLLAQELPGPISLLKLPHHGSRHSPVDELLRHTQPQWAVVSVGRDNRFGFPHEATLAALAAAEVSLLRSDRDGTVRFIPESDRWRATRWLDGDFH